MKIGKQLMAFVLVVMLVLGTLQTVVNATEDAGVVSETAIEAMEEKIVGDFEKSDEEYDTPAEELKEDTALTNVDAEGIEIHEDDPRDSKEYIESNSTIESAVSEKITDNENENKDFFTVTLDANGGFFANEWDDFLEISVDKTETLKKVITAGTDVSVIPLNDQEDTAVFLGWSLERDGALITVKDYIPVDDYTLFAIWGKDNSNNLTDDGMLQNEIADELADGYEDETIDTQFDESTIELAQESEEVSVERDTEDFVNELDEVPMDEPYTISSDEPFEDVSDVNFADTINESDEEFVDKPFDEAQEVSTDSGQYEKALKEDIGKSTDFSDEPSEAVSDVDFANSDNDSAEESENKPLDGTQVVSTDSDQFDQSEKAFMEDIQNRTDNDENTVGIGDNVASPKELPDKKDDKNDFNNEILISDSETDSVVSDRVFDSVSTPTDGNRYTVLLLDNSGSMANNSRLTIAKQAAIRFCEQMLSADGINYISVVGFESSVKCAYDFTNQIDTLKSEINNMSANGGTNTNSALKQAEALLNNVSANSSNNIVLLSDGIPESGDTSETGRYSKTDHNTSYKYGNVIYSTAKSMDNSWNIYTMGFFQGVTGNDLSFGQKLLYDIQNHGYYDVQNADELEVVFDEISAGILDDLTIVGPLNAEDGDDITITATFKSEGSVPGISNIKWNCEPEYLYFDNIRLEGPEITGEENFWRISVDADVAFPDVSGKKTGSRTASISVSVGQYTVRKEFTVKAQTTFKAEKNGFPVGNENDDFEYPSDYHFPYRRYIQAIGGNLISTGISIDIAVTSHIYEDQFKGAVWKGNCGALSILAAAEYEGKIDLKHTYFSNNRGSVLSKYGYQKKTSSRYSFRKDSEFVKLVEKVQIAAQGCAQIRNCRVFKNDADYSKLISELKKGNGKPYVVYLKGHHAVVIDPSKSIIECDNGETMIHIYDPNTPYAGYKLDHPYNRYISNPNSDQREDVPMLVVSSSGNAKISYPGKTYTWYMYEGTTRDQVEIYDISKLNPDFFTSATYIGFTRGNIITDYMDLTWDTDNKLTLNGLKVFSSNENANCGAFIRDSDGAQDESFAQDRGMYYFDADATLIDYESPLAAVTLVNDLYPAMYMIANEGQAKVSVDLENHAVQVVAQENEVKISVASNLGDDGEDAYSLNFVLKKDQIITVSRDGEALLLEKESSCVDNTDASSPVVVTAGYANSERNNSETITVTDSAYVTFDRSAVKYEVIDGSCGEGVFWRLSESGTLYIYGEGLMDNYKVQNGGCTYPWKNYADRINKIIIGDHISEIGECAFAYTSVQDVDFGSGVGKIGRYAFLNCNNLYSIELPDSVTYIDSDAFSHCENLSILRLSDNLEYLAGFNGCKTLENVDIPESVKTIGYLAFMGCQSLKEICLPRDLITIQDLAFCNCKTLTEIEIPPSVSTIGSSVFEGCSGLKSIFIPPNADYNDTGSFYGCSNLERISFPDTVKKIGFWAFYHCSNMQNIIIPSGVTEIGDCAFRDCASLKRIYIPLSVNSIGKDLFCGSTLDTFTLEELYYEGTESQWNNILFGDNSKGWFSKVEKHFNSVPPDINNAMISGINGKIFSGEEITQSPVVKYSGVILTENVDYTVWYKDNTNVGTATIIIVGMGDYTGIKIVNFKIKGVSLAGADVSGVVDEKYTGYEITQSPIVKMSGNVLQEGTDYELVYSDNLEVGTACLTISGKGNYTGTKSIYFDINPASIENASILGVSGKKYIGEEIKQLPIVKLLYKSLQRGKDYDIVYKNNKNVGYSSIIIHGKGNYTGEKTAVFKIDACPINNSIVTGISIKTYTGKAITQTPVVTFGSNTLKAGTDYIVYYANNTNAGTATITITGKGNYNGIITSTFVINKAAQTITAKASASAVAVGKTVTVSTTGAKGKVSYKSADKTIATVNASTGVVTAKKVGKVKITAASAATANYKAASKTVTISVVPAATTKITAANLSGKGIKLTYAKVAGANGYIIYRNGKEIKTVSGGSTVTWTDAAANTNGGKYTYKIVAKGSTGKSTLSRSLTTYRVARPALSSAANTAAGKMTVKWGKNTKATGYQIQYSTSAGFASGNKTVNIKNAATVSKVIGSLKKGKTYYVRIRTYKTAGSTNYWSAWSAKKSVKISK